MRQLPIALTLAVIFFIATTASTTNLARAGPLEELGELVKKFNSTETTTTTNTYTVPPMQDLIDNMNNAIDRETAPTTTGQWQGIQQQMNQMLETTADLPQKDSNIIVLSHHFETDGLPKIIGEVENNNSRTYDRFDVDISVNFRDAAGTLIVSEDGHIDAETLAPGESSAFQAISFDESLPDTASTYDIIVEDNRVVVDAPLEGDSDSSSNDDSDEDDEDN